MLQKSIEEVKATCQKIANFYKIDHLESDIEIWFNLCKSKKLKSLDLVDVFEEAKEFFPSVKLALEIAMALPCTTATVERSFSTLRKVKTWIRSTMKTDRLNGNLIYN